MAEGTTPLPDVVEDLFSASAADTPAVPTSRLAGSVTRHEIGATVG